MSMGIKEEIIDALGALNPQVDKSKALLELDISAVSISRLLMEPVGVKLIEYICEELKCGQLPIYSMNKFIDKTEFDRLIEHFYVRGEQKTLDVLLLLHHQLWTNKQNVNPRENFETLKKLEKSKAVNSNATTLRSICLDCCFINLKNYNGKCDECSSENILEIYEFFLSEPPKNVLKNGQYLEIYVKECMNKSGIELIGWNSEDGDKKIYTSIKYQIEGEDIDVDVHGISQPIAVLLCEAKTSKKITMNEMRRVENLFDRLIEKINDLTGKKIQHLKLFVITGEFDSNISVGAYRRKMWELIDRSKISDLTEEFRRIQSEI